MTTTPRVVILVDDEPALTLEMATERYGFTAPSATRTALVRLDPRVEPVAWLSGRTPLYSRAVLDAAMAGRPGRGAPGVPKGRRTD